LLKDVFEKRYTNPGITAVVIVVLLQQVLITLFPRFRSGSSNRNNLLPSCQQCNNHKGSTKMEEWYMSQDFFSDEKYQRIKDWTNQEVLDLFQYTSDYMNYKQTS
jgi:hypothetical protein